MKRLLEWPVKTAVLWCALPVLLWPKNDLIGPSSLGERLMNSRLVRWALRP